jgi:hypothetical protein
MVKKLAVFLMFFALITASAAADLEIGGSFEVAANIAKGDTWSDNDPTTSMERDMAIIIGGETENGMFGAKGALLKNTNFWVYAWWKPIELVMVKMGAVFEDSTWATGMSMEELHNNKFFVRLSNDFAGGVLKDRTGFFVPAMSEAQMERSLQLSVYPIKGLSLNLGFPMDLSAYDNIAEFNYVYNIHAQAAYEIEGVGTAAVSFINAIEDKDEFKQVFAQWEMPIGNSMTAAAGFNMGFNSEVTAPLNIGLSFGWGKYAEDALVVNFRFGVSVPMEDTQDTNIGFDIVPSYDFSFARVYVPFGIGVNLPAADGDSTVHWYVNPYITKKLSVPYFYAGVQIHNNVVGDGIDWAIPLGFRWDF